jgi:hypothetical protein
MEDIPMTIKEQIENIGNMVFKNIEDDFDKVEVHFKDNNFDFYDPKEMNITITKIVNKPNKNKLLKKYLIEVTDDEKFVFKLEIYTNTCICSESKKYIGEIMLNTNPDYESVFELHMYEKVKRGVYHTEYVLINSFLSQ